jgi:hypothetical protein
VRIGRRDGKFDGRWRFLAFGFDFGKSTLEKGESDDSKHIPEHTDRLFDFKVKQNDSIYCTCYVRDT